MTSLMPHLRLSVGALAIAGTVLLAGCGSSEPVTRTTTTEETTHSTNMPPPPTESSTTTTTRTQQTSP